MISEPQKEHNWLQKLVGEWTYEAEMIMKPEEAPVKSQGTESVRPLGGLWVLAEGQGEMPGGGAATTMMTLGYDPEKRRYVGTWVGSMMSHMWLYNGSLNSDESTLTLDTEGPGMAGDGSQARYQDVIQIKSGDQRTLSSQVLGDDGKWNRFMTITFRRVK